MEIFRTLERDDAALVGWGVSVLLATSQGSAGQIARRIAGLGGSVLVQDELYYALGMLLDDPRCAQMLVIDCDAFGGMEQGRRAFATLADDHAQVPVVLISAQCPEQVFSDGREAPIILRAPVSAVSLRVAFEVAFRWRFVQGTD